MGSLVPRPSHHPVSDSLQYAKIQNPDSEKAYIGMRLPNEFMYKVKSA